MQRGIIKLNKEKQTETKKAALSLIAFIILFVFYGWYHSKVYVSSDSVTTFPMSLDLLKGNILLKGWVLGTNNFYFTEIVPYSIGHLLGFTNTALINWLPGIAWAGGSIGMYYFLEDFLKKNIKGCLCTYILYLEIFAVIAPAASYTLLNANSHNNLYALLIVWLLIMKKYMTSCSGSALVWMLILGVMLEFSEGVTTMVLIGPVFVFSIIRLFVHKDHKSAVLIAIDVFSFAGGKAMLYLFKKLGGMKTIGMPAHICRVLEMPERFFKWIGEIGTLGGSKLVPGGNIELFQFLIIILTVALFAVILFDLINYKKLVWQEQLMLWIAVLNLGACVITDVPIFHRYIVPFYYFAIVLLLSQVLRLLNNISIYSAYNILFAVLMLLGACYGADKIRFIIQMPTYDNGTNEIISTIEKKKLGNGYADFWAGPPVAFFSDYNINVYPVTIFQGDTQIHAYTELINYNWYYDDNIHYIICQKDTDASLFIDEGQMNAILGKPDKTYSFANYVIYYWNKDISENLAR